MIRFFRGLLVATAALCALASTAYSQNITIKDGSGASQTMCTVVVGGVNTACVQAGGITSVSPSTATLTRPANTTAYAQNEAVCSSTTGASCLIQIPVAGATNDTGTLSTFTLWKTTATAATWAVDLYSGAATVTSISAGDQAADLGPVTADAGIYLGTYICQTTLSTNNSGAFYACAPQSPGPGGVQFKTVSGQSYVYGILRMTASAGYTPGSGEVFTIATSAYPDR